MNTFSNKGIIAFNLTLLCLTYQWAFSQTIQNEVIASGGSSSLIEDKLISWTLGECVTETFTSGDLMVSQGFNQPFFILLSLPDEEPTPFGLSISPNPTRDMVTIRLTGQEDQEEYSFLVYDLNGNVLFRKEISQEISVELDLKANEAGMLLLYVERKSDGYRQGYKIIRIGH